MKLNSVRNLWQLINKRFHTLNIILLLSISHLIRISLKMALSTEISIYSKDSNSSKSFKFTDYDCIGLDLDNTICKYGIGPMLRMEYEVLSKFLIEQRQYDPRYLDRPIEEDLDFLLRGLILDFYKGNILKINNTGKIVRAAHGTRTLTLEEIETEYGKDRHWKVTDIFVKNYLETWNGPLSDKMRALLDYFDMPVTLIFARLIDTIDEIEGKALKKYNIWPDILDGLVDMFNINNFKFNKGGYFPNILSNPNLYIEKCSDEIINWIKALKSKDKKLFLVTGSGDEFASFAAKICMGKKWASLFDIVIFNAKKPWFFIDNRPFISTKTGDTIPNNNLKKNNSYCQGNWSSLNQFLSVISNKNQPKIVYLGDNLIQDIYTPSLYNICDTVAICEEFKAEDVFGFKNGHKWSEFLVSDRWGSYFGGEEETDSVWLDIIKKHSRLCAPDLDFFACKPVDYEYKM